MEGFSLHPTSKFVLISSCLLGNNVKYDGGNNKINDTFIQMLLDNGLVIPICPEVDGGLLVPRIPVEISGKKAINQAGIDKMKEFTKGAHVALQKAKFLGVKMAIMKSKSPSCGKDFIYDGTFTRTLTSKDGISVSLLKKYGVEVFDENELDSAYKFWSKIYFNDNLSIMDFF